MRIIYRLPTRELYGGLGLPKAIQVLILVGREGLFHDGFGCLEVIRILAILEEIAHP
jgi:hypothetical protein